MPKDCLSPYSVSKTGGEELCKVYNSLYGVKTVTLRYFNVYGNRQPLKGPYAPVIGLFARQTKENNPMTIVGDGLQTRDFTHVQDVVRANILAALSEDDRIYGEIFNIKSQNFRIQKIFQKIFSVFVWESLQKKKQKILDFIMLYQLVEMLMYLSN